MRWEVYGSNVCDNSSLPIRQFNHGTWNFNIGSQQFHRTHYMITSTSINNPCIGIISSPIYDLSKEDWVLEVSKITCNNIRCASHSIGYMRCLTCCGLWSRTRTNQSQELLVLIMSLRSMQDWGKIKNSIGLIALIWLNIRRNLMSNGIFVVLELESWWKTM